LSIHKCNKVVRPGQKIVAINIKIAELLALDTALNEITRQRNLPPSVAALRLFNEIRDYSKIGGLKKELLDFIGKNTYLFKLARTTLD
jgi:hypothetical protein